MHKNIYNTIFCQTFSPCGNLLTAGDIYGSIHVFFLNKILNSDNNLNKEELLPKFKISVKEDYPINALLTTHDHLIVGTVGEIVAFTWRNVKTNKNIRDWSIELPENKDGFNKTDVNCLIYHEENRHLYVGCGDNAVYVYDIETRDLLKTLDKHKDYIHSICLINNELISGGEDGVVNIWDIRTNQVVNKITPSLENKISRPNLGKWIGAVSANDDYILCGGGPRLALWHFRFLSHSTIFPIDDNGIHIAEIYDEKILAGGRSKLFYQMNFVGDIVSEIPTSAGTTYSAIHHSEPNNVLCIAGSSPKIDICNNFMYKNQQLSLC